MVFPMVFPAFSTAKECKLTLPEDAPGFTTSFVYDFNQRISEAIAARLPQWMQCLGGGDTLHPWDLMMKPRGFFHDVIMTGYVKIAIENGHRNSEFFQLQNGDVPVRYVNVYQRVS